MSNRARHRDGQLPAWIEIPKQHLSHGATRFLSEVPAFEDDGHVLSNIVDRERAPVEKKRNDRLARRHHGFDEVFLPANQVEAGAVAHMLPRPGFTRSLFIAAD